MNFNFQLTDRFKSEFKKIKKKHKSLTFDFSQLLNEIKENPNLGTDLGSNLRKIRMRISSKNAGKSSGARVIAEDVIISTKDRNIIFISIYDKSDKESISINEIKQIIKDHHESKEE